MTNSRHSEIARLVSRAACAKDCTAVCQQTNFYVRTQVDDETHWFILGHGMQLMRFDLPRQIQQQLR